MPPCADTPNEPASDAELGGASTHITTVPPVGDAPHSADERVNAVLAELGGQQGAVQGQSVDAKVIAATRAHQRLQAILSADRD
ncbi:hypothetical protein BH23ACT6_BH23ACT6_16520 [soil metagenome]